MRKIAVSLFDESGNMLRPWADAGYECHMFDIVNTHRCENNMIWRQADLDLPSYAKLIVALKPNFICSFPPCTDLAVSGAAHFAAKLAKDPDCQTRAVRRAKLAAQIADELGVPYMIENPISVLSTLWRKPDYIFNPWEYGGYLPIDDRHPRWPEYIAPRDAYPKKTCLWVGNGFVMPPKKPVPVEPGYSAQHKKLGGKSAKTKQIRSETPRGFAIAVKESNCV